MIYFLKILLAFLLTFVSNAFSEVDDYYPYVIDTPEECAMKVAEHNYPFIAWPYQIKPKAYIIVYEDLFDCKRNPFSTCIDFIYCSIDKSSGSYSSYQEQYYSNDHGEDFIGRADFFEECAQNNFYLEKNGKNYCDFPLEYMYSTSSPIKKYPIFFFFRGGSSAPPVKVKETIPKPIPYKNEKKRKGMCI